jgi:hypothetical protein
MRDRDLDLDFSELGGRFELGCVIHSQTEL